FAQSHRVNVRVAIRRVVEFNVRDLGRELAIADEIEIVAGRIPNWIERIEHLIGHAVDLAVRPAPDVNLRKAIAVRGVAEGQEIAGWRPDVIANLSAWRVDNLRHLLVGQGDDEDLSVFVAESNAFAVR